MNPNIEPLIATKEQLVDFVKEQMNWVTLYLTENPSETWMPCVMVHAKEDPEDTVGSRLLFALPDAFINEQTKVFALFTLGRMVNVEHKMIPVMVALSSEVWMAHDSDYKPRNHPNRVEAISITATNIGFKECALATMIFGRNKALGDKGGEGIIVPKPWDELATDKVKPYVLEHFYRGYFEETAKQMGHGSLKDKGWLKRE
jgi:hypothetical protein